MAPSKKAQGDSAASTDILTQLEDLKNLVAGYATRFDSLDKALEEVKQENKKLAEDNLKLKKHLEDRDKELLSLREKMNDQEQYIRGWSVRILNIDIPEAEASDPSAVMQHVYQKLLHPILVGARSRGLLKTIPGPEEILETAHILPAKPGTTPPIICRFYTRNIRSMIFKLKRDFAPREEVEPSQQSRGERYKQGKFMYPIYEDLTKANFLKLRALGQHEKVQSCWSVNGSLKFKLKDNDTVRRVKSVYDTVENIIS